MQYGRTYKMCNLNVLLIVCKFNFEWFLVYSNIVLSVHITCFVILLLQLQKSSLLLQSCKSLQLLFVCLFVLHFRWSQIHWEKGLKNT
jgi:hypothetical protein